MNQVAFTTNRNVDWINVMTYDLVEEQPTATSQHAALQPAAHQTGSAAAELNVVMSHASPSSLALYQHQHQHYHAAAS